MDLLKASHLPTFIGIVRCKKYQADNSVFSNRKKKASEVVIAKALKGLDPSHTLQDIITLYPTSVLSSTDAP